MLNRNFVNELVQEDGGYRFLKKIRRSPVFWESKKKDIYAILRTIGCPTWFLTLSANEANWFPLLRNLMRSVHGREDVTDEELRAMSYQQRAELIATDPIQHEQAYVAESRDSMERRFDGNLSEDTAEVLDWVPDVFVGTVEFAQLASGTKLNEVPGTVKFSGGPKHVEMNSLLLTPVPVTKDNLDIVIDANWIKKDEVCQGVRPGTIKVCG